MTHLPQFAEIADLCHQAAGLTQADIAAELGVCERTIARWCARNAGPTTYIARKWLYQTHIKGTPYDPHK